MEEETLARNDSAAAAIEEAAQRQAEELRSERASLQSDLKAAVVRVNTLSAFVEELKVTNASYEAQVVDLKRSILSFHAAWAEGSDRLETKLRSLEAVSKGVGVADLWGDFSQLHLHNDLLAAMARSDRNETVAEAIRLKESLEKWQREVLELEAKHSEAKKVDDVLKLAVERLAGEKNALEEKKGEAEAKIVELGGNVASLERVLEEKNEKLGKVKLEMAALEAKVGVYEAKLENMRKVENENKPAVDDGAEQMVRGEGHKAAGVKFPWMMVAASTGAVAAVAAVGCDVYHVKSRWGRVIEHF